MFYMYVFFRVPNWPKIGIFLGLGFSSTFGLSPPPPCHIFLGVPTLGFKSNIALMSIGREKKTTSVHCAVSKIKVLSLNMFLHFGYFSSSCSYKKVSYIKRA